MNFVKIERVVSFDGSRKSVRLSAYANKAPLTRLCAAEMDATEPIDGDYLMDVVNDFRRGNFPE